MTDVVTWMPYVPKNFYRDLVGVDPHHTDKLRQRDMEIFAARGRFARAVVPTEFVAETMARLGADSYVVVSFGGRGQWYRQRADRHVMRPYREGKR